MGGKFVEKKISKKIIEAILCCCCCEKTERDRKTMKELANFNFLGDLNLKAKQCSILIFRIDSVTMMTSLNNIKMSI